MLREAGVKLSQWRRGRPVGKWVDNGNGVKDIKEIGKDWRMSLKKKRP
jgi:hypothetical protein